jgi:DNA (cytosine-5)-methyltransferase 1
MEKTIKVGSDFSGVGAFDYAIKRIAEKKNFTIENIFACDMDKYARQSYLANHEEPNYYPENVYEREIPTESLDIFMTSPPCQSFSLAGKRKGKTDKRGVLFFNSHEFIKKNKPRFFIFENVKGLLSDDNGNTFNEWVNMLGGKSVNGNPIIFDYEDSVPYHLYFKVLNTKEHGVPQNRERIFLIGIRDDDDNDFQFPKEEPLKKKLKDLLEPFVDEKYFLSEKMLENITLENKQNGEVANLNKGGERGSVYSESTEAMSCLTATDYKQPKQILVKSNTKKGYDIATENDSINFNNLASETRRGRVGVGVAQTLDTQCNQGVIVHNITKIVSVRKYEVDILGLQKTLKEHKKLNNQQIANELQVPKTMVEHWFRTDTYFSIPDKDIWNKLKELLEITTNEFDESIITFEEKDNVFEKSNRAYDENGIAPTLTTMCGDDSIIVGGTIRDFKNEKGEKEGFREVSGDVSPTLLARARNDGSGMAGVSINFKVRKLTPLECFRCQDFPDSHVENAINAGISNSQLYKQAGNSITVRVLEKIIDKLKL